MKDAQPLYISFRESFSKDFYLPSTPIVGAPVVVTEVLEKESLSCLTSPTPPQNVILHLNGQLKVVDREGEPLAALLDVLRLCTRTLPVFYIHDFNTVGKLADFTDFHRIADAHLCTSYEKRDILYHAYRKMPLLRGVMDFRGEPLPAEPAVLPGMLVAHGAVMAIFDGAACDRSTVHQLQQRFIHVTCTSEGGIAEAAAKGVNGILNADPAACYACYEKFPENSFLRRPNLYAHKGFQNNGMFSENTITGVRAAADYGFDGAEIDVKLTSDCQPIVMHNLNTKGLFDCEEKIIEQTPYEELKPLRRIGFPEEGVDLFEDLMTEMRDRPDCPVLIELKPSAKYNRVEEMVARVGEILARPNVQKNCICIMGMLTPGLDYVHKKLPYLPICHCESVKLAPPATREEAEDRIYRVTFLTAGWAAGYNCEDVMINRTFYEYAKMRGLTVFPWSRSWTMAPSLWENNGVACDATYLAGFDSWTTDHGDMYLHLPVELRAGESTATEWKAGELLRPFGTAFFRNGDCSEIGTELLILEGEAPVEEDGGYRFAQAGKRLVMLSLPLELHFGDVYRIYSEPFVLNVN